MSYSLKIDDKTNIMEKVINVIQELDFMQIFDYLSILSLILGFTFIWFKRNGKSDRLLIDAIAVGLVCEKIPTVILLILSAFDSDFLDDVDSLSSTLALFALVFGYYIVSIIQEKSNSNLATKIEIESSD